LATLQPQGSISDPVYIGRIDGSLSGLNALLVFAQALNCSGVNSSIGTRWSFNLSGNDRVTFNTHFEVNLAPLPAGVWLLGSAFASLLGWKRKRA
jgi:hypothetical protein